LENLVVAVIRVRTIKDIHHAFERDYQLNFGKTVLIWDK
jgi:ribitol-5-phosphate 2-dehydrogenase